MGDRIAASRGEPKHGHEASLVTPPSPITPRPRCPDAHFDSVELAAARRWGTVSNVSPLAASSTDTVSQTSLSRRGQPTSSVLSRRSPAAPDRTVEGAMARALAVHR